MTPDADLIVIGGGPAGLAAAAAAAELGLDTVLYDEQPALGGQIYRAVERDRPTLRAILGADYGRGSDLVRAFHASGAKLVSEAGVWEVTADGTVGVLAHGAAALVRARRVLITAGAMERPVPIPGWTLPGVMTAGAAQALLKASAMVPDRPAVLAGSGPLLLLLANQLLAAGAEIEALLDTAPSGNLRRALAHLPAALAAGDYLWRGLRLMRGVRRGGVRKETGVTGLQALGNGRLQGVGFVNGAGRREEIPAEILFLHEGIVPNNQLTMAAGCRHGWDADQRFWRVAADVWGTTDLEAIAVAGDCAGIGGALAAEHRGRLAALETAHRLGVIDRRTRDRRAAPERARLARHLRIRPFLDALYAPAAAARRRLDDAVLVCRCEEVTAGQIRQAAAEGCPGPNQVKAFTRCGMGPCQGRMCGLATAEIIAEARAVTVPEVGHFRLRPPVKPITLGELAGMDGVGREVEDLGGLPTAPGSAAAR